MAKANFAYIGESLGLFFDAPFEIRESMRVRGFNADQAPRGRGASNAKFH